MNTIETTEDLDALPIGSVILYQTFRSETEGVAVAATKNRDGDWTFTGRKVPYRSVDIVEGDERITVVHDPTQPAPAGVIDREAAHLAGGKAYAEGGGPDDVVDAVLAVLHTRTVAQVKAEAWDEGYATGHDCVGAATDCTRRPNPYRADELEREDGR